MKKYNCETTINTIKVKRTVKMEQVETLFLMCDRIQIQPYLTAFDITFFFPSARGGNKSTTVEQIPHRYKNKFIKE